MPSFPFANSKAQETIKLFSYQVGAVFMVFLDCTQFCRQTVRERGSEGSLVLVPEETSKHGK